MREEPNLLVIIVTLLKIVAVMFFLRVFLTYIGFPGYIFGLDEVYNFFMSFVFSLGSGKAYSIPSPL